MYYILFCENFLTVPANGAQNAGDQVQRVQQQCAAWRALDLAPGQTGAQRLHPGGQQRHVSGEKN